MNRIDRLNEVYEWLRYKKLISSKKEFAAHIGVDKTNLSSAFNGRDKYLTNNLFAKIANAFPQLNLDWLLTGEGEMSQDSDTHISIVHLPNSAASVNGNAIIHSLKEHDELIRLREENKQLKERLAELKQINEYLIKTRS